MDINVKPYHEACSQCQRESPPPAPQDGTSTDSELELWCMVEKDAGGMSEEHTRFGEPNDVCIMRHDGEKTLQKAKHEATMAS